LLADDVIVCVKGRIDTRDDTPKLVCVEMKRPELALDTGREVHLKLPLNALSDETVGRLKRLLGAHPGGSPVFLHVNDKVIRLSEEFNVDDRNGFLAELRELLGPGCLWNETVPIS
jgi:DNA polymerase III subunit alpha